MAVPQVNEHKGAGTVSEPAAAASEPAASEPVAPVSEAASNGHPAGEPARPEVPDAADLVAMLDMLLPGGTVGALHRFRPDASTLRCAMRLAMRPAALARRTSTLAAELAQVAAGTSTIVPARRDRRFADPAWSENPALKRTVQGYLAISQAAEGLLEDAGLDWRDNERVKFILINLIAAAAPSNNPLLSPVAWKAVIDTGGLSIIRGLRALISDMSSAPHVPTMVEPDAFTIGKDLAVTPGAVVARTDVYELIQYEPTTPTVYRFPILMVPPMINKYYITDLAPGRSMLEFFVAQGYQVFVLSWRNPGKESSHWNVNTYGGAVCDSLDAVRSITKAPKVNLAGLCAGGITSSMVCAHLAAAGHLDEISTLFLGVTLLDQSQAGTTVALMDAPIAAASVMSSRVRGYMDGKTLAEVFAWLRPDDLVWNYWVNNYLQGKPPPAFDILYWNADTTRMPAGLHRDFIKLAQANALTKADVATMLGSPVDLSKVGVDAYIVGGVDDHIAPWKMAYRATQLLGGTIKFVLSTSGHVASMVNPPSNPKATFRIGPSNPADPDEWLAQAETEHGSWWSDYTAWLTDRSGGTKPRPRTLGSSKYPPLTPAPGTYILET